MDKRTKKNSFCISWKFSVFPTLLWFLSLHLGAYAEPVGLGSEVPPNVALPEENAVFPVLVWAEKYPMKGAVVLQLSLASYFGDKFTQTRSVDLSGSYFLNADFAVLAGANLLSSELTTEHGLLSVAGFRPTVVEPARIIYLGLSYRFAYGKFLVGKKLVRASLFFDVAPLWINSRLMASANRAAEQKEEKSFGLKMELKALFPLGPRFSLGVFSGLYLYKRPFSNFSTFDLKPTSDLRKDFTVGLASTVRFGL